MHLADTLSGACLPETSAQQQDLETVNSYLSISEQRLQDIKEHTQVDDSLQAVTTLIKSDWPEKKKRF